MQRKEFLSTMHLRNCCDNIAHINANKGVYCDIYSQFIISAHIGVESPILLNTMSRVLISMLCGINIQIVLFMFHNGKIAQTDMDIYENALATKYLGIYGYEEFNCGDLAREIVKDNHSSDFVTVYARSLLSCDELIELGCDIPLIDQFIAHSR
jgi:hypothetical protein